MAQAAASSQRWRNGRGNRLMRMRAPLSTFPQRQYLISRHRHRMRLAAPARTQVPTRGGQVRQTSISELFQAIAVVKNQKNAMC
jgi:hypothetical protein